MEFYEYQDQADVADDDMVEFSLWYSDWEEAGICTCYLAVTPLGDIVGFLTVNGDSKCVAIEVLEDYRGMGIARCLCEASNCYRPERNECPEFWDKMTEFAY